MTIKHYFSAFLYFAFGFFLFYLVYDHLISPTINDQNIQKVKGIVTFKDEHEGDYSCELNSLKGEIYLGSNHLVDDNKLLKNIQINDSLSLQLIHNYDHSYTAISCQHNGKQVFSVDDYLNNRSNSIYLILLGGVLCMTISIYLILHGLYRKKWNQQKKDKTLQKLRQEFNVVNIVNELIIIEFENRFFGIIHTYTNELETKSQNNKNELSVFIIKDENLDNPSIKLWKDKLFTHSITWGLGMRINSFKKKLAKH